MKVSHKSMYTSQQHWKDPHKKVRVNPSHARGPQESKSKLSPAQLSSEKGTVGHVIKGWNRTSAL